MKLFEFNSSRLLSPAARCLHAYLQGRFPHTSAHKCDTYSHLTIWRRATVQETCLHLAQDSCHLMRVVFCGLCSCLPAGLLYI